MTAAQRGSTTPIWCAALRQRTSSSAESEFYRRLAPRVRLYCLKHLRDRQAASDLVQQVLMLTLERLRAGKLRDAERLVSFVFGTCRMTVLELRRTGARRERLLQRYASDVPMADPSSAPRLDHARLVGCLEALSERERSVLVMTFYEDQPAKQVAAALALSEGNVRVIRHRGLERLRGPTRLRGSDAGCDASRILARRA